MVNRRTSVDFSKCGQCLSVTFLIKSEIPLNRFFDDPASRPFEPFRKAVESTGELVWNVCGHDTIGHVNHSKSV